MRSSAESFAGPWRGVLAKGEALSPADFRFFGSEGGYQGIFWGRALTPIALSGVQLGRSVHFEIPQMGVFDGTSSGETMEGMFRDGTGGGSFTLEKQLDWDDPRNRSLSGRVSASDSIFNSSRMACSSSGRSLACGTVARLRAAAA